MGAIYTENILNMIRAGRLNTGVEAIILGYMGNEGALFELVFPSPPQEVVLSMLPREWSKDIRRYYLGVEQERPADAGILSPVNAAEFIANGLFHALH